MNAGQGSIPPWKWASVEPPTSIASYYQKVGWLPHSEAPDSWFVNFCCQEENAIQGTHIKLSYTKQFIFTSLNRNQESANIWEKKQ